MIPFHSVLPLSGSPIALDSYSPQSVKGRALEEEIQALCCKGAVEPASPSPGFYSHMFVVTKALGGWRPIIDLSTLNLSVVKVRFRLETAQSVLRSVWRNDWMVSIDLKDAYLHPSSRKYLRFTAGGRAWQFKVLCFSLSMVPQVFTRVVAPVSGFLHQLGKGQGPESLSGPRHCSEFGQVCAHSVSVSGPSGDQDRVTDFPGFTEGSWQKNFCPQGAVCEVLEGSARPPSIADTPRSGRSASDEGPSVGSQTKLGLPRRLSLDTLGLPFSKGSSVVVCRGSL